MANATQPNPRPPPTSNPQRGKALARVQRGILDVPLRTLIYGVQKVGKSTFASGAPAPIFISADNGTAELDVARWSKGRDFDMWTDVLALLEELATEPHDYKTVVVDPVNWLEPLCWDHICKQTGSATIEDVGGGYKKGYIAAVEQWRLLVHALERCQARGMNVILTAHAVIKTVKNPEGPDYDRYTIAMHEKAAGLLMQWVSDVLFARVETYAKKEKGDSRARGFSTENHIICTKGRAAYDAGTRFVLPEELPLSWDNFVSEIRRGKELADELSKQLVAMLGELDDAAITKATMAWLETNKTKTDRLTEAVNRLGKKLEEKKSKEQTNHE